MKKQILAILLVMSAQAFSQDMKPYAKKPTTQKNKEIAAVLLEDKTDSLKYIVGKFTCHNFSKTLYVQRSTLVTDLAPYNLEAMASDWGNIVVREEKTKKLPIYIATIYNVESGFYHSINAVLVKPESPGSLDSYVFLEPQTDQIFDSAKAMYAEYAEYLKATDTGKVLEVDIGTFEGMKFTGTIWQSQETSFLKDRVSP
jgi:hypothetical protein